MSLKRRAPAMISLVALLIASSSAAGAGDFREAPNDFRRPNIDRPHGGHHNHRRDFLRNFEPEGSMIEARRAPAAENETEGLDFYAGSSYGTADPGSIYVAGADGRWSEEEAWQPHLMPMAKIIDVSQGTGCRYEAGVCVIRP